MPIINATRQMLANIRRLANPGAGSRFWIGQVMVIASTILGVYLAAYAGFERALEFDVLVNKRSAYHLITAMEAELKDNIEVNNKLIKTVSKGQYDRTYFVRRAPMGHFVWDAMLETDKTFQVPAEIITGVRRYYQTINILREELASSKIQSKYFIQRVKEEHKKLEENVLPGIEAEKKLLVEMLGRLDIEIG
jgi:hypothetical protein